MLGTCIPAIYIVINMLTCDLEPGFGTSHWSWGVNLLLSILSWELNLLLGVGTIIVFCEKKLD